jgi:hypothetical protein
VNVNKIYYSVVELSSVAALENVVKETEEEFSCAVEVPVEVEEVTSVASLSEFTLKKLKDVDNLIVLLFGLLLSARKVVT